MYMLFNVIRCNIDTMKGLVLEWLQSCRFRAVKKRLLVWCTDACRLASKIGASPGTHRDAKTSGAADQPHMGWARLSFYRLKIIETYWNGFSMVFFSKVCEKMLAAPVYIRLIDVSLACFLIPKLTSSGGWWLPQIVTQDLEVVLRQSLSTLSPGNWTLKRF